jgi:hypothetical protein
MQKFKFYAIKNLPDTLLHTNRFSNLKPQKTFKKVPQKLTKKHPLKIFAIRIRTSPLSIHKNGIHSFSDCLQAIETKKCRKSYTTNEYNTMILNVENQ